MTARLATYLFIFIFGYVHAGEPSVQLVDLTSQTLTVFYDFDRTLLVESFGGKVLDRCYEIFNRSEDVDDCAGSGEMIQALETFPDARIISAFGNETRLAQLKNHLDTLLSSSNALNGGLFYILSTSWEAVPALEWEKMIWEIIQIVELEDYFPRDNILGLDDPGPGIQADKGTKLQTKLASLDIDITMSQCIFADDKLGNLNWANCEGTDADGNSCEDYGGDRAICDTLLIQEREGMDGTDMGYIEARGILPAVCEDANGCDRIKMTVVFVLSMICIAFC
mmetsp:Transcript_51854/g.46544  ORF Transcript_51854/g.46544 Transcript_51854/m.46544 type:complete len:281 (+) Transcript_51854:40-882(+)|eukprot:CAMPEP_0201564778 /NCGR_PEP_ID=MMETSP0190_2-20130828/3342_1 /ASSEMBLY_ACC=CAM_ASM_000263 /TAXON_ID=37353 /ORGANISM="Rosalina sp." /LENGTH=280 /DNA_ID=CAMNT_0047981405 /DNA_START=32 /DNA_END=874 /DNA_ORIENTATION=+